NQTTNRDCSGRQTGARALLESSWLAESALLAVLLPDWACAPSTRSYIADSPPRTVSIFSGMSYWPKSAFLDRRAYVRLNEPSRVSAVEYARLKNVASFLYFNAATS